MLGCHFRTKEWELNISKFELQRIGAANKLKDYKQMHLQAETNTSIYYFFWLDQL